MKPKPTSRKSRRLHFLDIRAAAAIRGDEDQLAMLNIITGEPEVMDYDLGFLESNGLERAWALGYWMAQHPTHKLSLTTQDNPLSNHLYIDDWLDVSVEA